MLLKKEVLKSLKELPDEFSVDEAIDRLILLHKVNKAQTEIKQGKGVSTEQVRRKSKKSLN